MEPHVLITALLLVAGLLQTADTYPAGLIYGPKAAYRIDAPNGWVLDNISGKSQGLHAVLYPTGSNWRDAKVIMYAKIASTSIENAEKFARWAIDDYKKDGDGFRHKRVKSGKTPEGYRYFINEYRHDHGYTRIESVAYIQLPKAVAYIVFSAEDDSLHGKHVSALNETVKSLRYMPAYIGYSPSE
jgi:hypothetical protein